MYTIDPIFPLSTAEPRQHENDSGSDWELLCDNGTPGLYSRSTITKQFSDAYTVHMSNVSVQWAAYKTVK